MANHPLHPHNRSRQSASRLNTEQVAAVRYIDGPLLVLAGAGSGKTSVITEKIAYLVKTCHIKADNIFAVTFTNKAAREMKERVGKLISAEQKNALRVSTFHTLGLNIIREEISQLPLRAGFSIFDSDDSQMLLKDFLIQNVRGDNKLLAIAQQTISGWKNALVDPAAALAMASSAGEQALAIAYQRYNDALRAYNAVDFDDLIQMPVQLLEQNADARARWQHKVRYLLVDEYQDTNSSQYQLVKLLVGDVAALTAVGDDDQSIYAWRGARPENLNQLQQDFPHLRIIKLEQNYRSTERILRVANTLIKNNPHLLEKKLWSELGEGPPLRVLQTENEDEETERIATDILTRCSRKLATYRDFAVLYRGNHQSRLLEIKLQQHQIPYAVSGGTSFFARSEIKDIMAYLRLLANPDDDNAFLRVINTPRRKIGASTLEKLAHYVQTVKAQQRQISLYAAIDDIGLQQQAKGESLDNLQRFTRWMDKVRHNCYENDAIAAIQEMINDMGYQSWLLQNSSSPQAAEKRMENVNYLIESLATSMKKTESTAKQNRPDDTQDAIGDAIAKLLLQDLLEQQNEEDLTDRVQLMTLHAAKGLEFPHVFIMGMEENLLPHRASVEQNTIDEERRLAYVGITRARQTLTFTLASQRKQYGDVTTCLPSRFLDELPKEDLAWEGGNIPTTPESRQKKAAETMASLKALFD